MGIRKLGLLVMVVLLCLGVLAVPLTGFAHGRVRVGIGFGWGGPVWVHPHPWHYYHGPYHGYYPYYPGPVIHVPVRVVPAPPPCREIWVEGRWERIAQEDARGFTTYRERWVPGHWERICH